MNEVKTNTDYQVPDYKEGQRLDNFLIPLLKIPRSLLYKSLRRGYIRLNSGKTTPCCRIKSNDIITVRDHLINTKPDNNNLQNKNRKLDVSWIDKFIVAEVDDFLVINKPSGLAVHGGSGQSLGLIEVLRARRADKHEPLELVHRLDKDTSGLILVSKKRSALRALSKLFAERHIKKTYYALLDGIIHKKTVCKEPLHIIRSKDGIRRAIVSSENGKESHTVFTPHLTTEGRTLCKVQLQTGRMHQIRAHALSLNKPIIGDRIYGIQSTRKQNTLHLHAFRLEFELKEKRYTFQVPIPENWCITEALNNKDGPWNHKTTS